MRTVSMGGVQARVSPGSAPLPPVRLSLADLLVITGPFAGPEGHIRHLSGTVGAGTWVDEALDEMRFRPQDGRLVSLWLRIPDTVAGREAGGVHWLGAEAVKGGLVLPRPDDFTVPPTRTRWCAEDGRALVCLTVGAGGAVGRRIRLAVAEDLELLFKDDEYVGWLLWGPERHLSASWEPPHGQGSDPRLGVWLAEYLSMLDEPTVEALESGDHQALEALTALASRVGREAHEYARRQQLRDHLAELTDWFG